MASFIPIILFSGLVILAIYLGGVACDSAAEARKNQ